MAIKQYICSWNINKTRNILMECFVHRRLTLEWLDFVWCHIIQKPRNGSSWEIWTLCFYNLHYYQPQCKKIFFQTVYYLGRVKQIWYLSPMRAAKVQASLRIRAISPEPPLLAHTSSESRGTYRQKARSLAPLNGWTCAVKICHNGMLEDTNSLDGAHFILIIRVFQSEWNIYSKQILDTKLMSWLT